MSTDDDKSEKINALRLKIAGTKEAIKRTVDPDTRAPVGSRRGLTGQSANSVACRWKPGQTGNPNGQPSTHKKIKFWLYVVNLLDMTMAEVLEIDENTMTLAQLGAKVFCVKVSEGKWAMVKEVIDRELGRIRELEEEDESGAPLLIKLPFKMTAG